jgi:iron complex transport system ATP-binding protein
VATLARIAAGPIATIVVVLHRLEDVPPGFTHALVRDGRILAAGPIDEVVTDAQLSDCFGTLMRVVRDDERWPARPA